MSFTSAALVVSWLAIALLALGIAGLTRQVSVLSRRTGTGAAADTGGAGAHGSATSAGSTAVSGRVVRTTSDLVGLAVPNHGDLGPLRQPGRPLVLFVSPGCASCHAVIGDVAALGLDPRVTVVSSGTCSGAEAAPSLTCIADARGVLDRLAVPATPYLMALDGEGVITATLVPTDPSDLRAFAEAVLGSGAVGTREEWS